MARISLFTPMRFLPSQMLMRGHGLQARFYDVYLARESNCLKLSASPCTEPDVRMIYCCPTARWIAAMKQSLFASSLEFASKSLRNFPKM